MSRQDRYNRRMYEFLSRKAQGNMHDMKDIDDRYARNNALMQQDNANRGKPRQQLSQHGRGNPPRQQSNGGRNNGGGGGNRSPNNVPQAYNRPRGETALTFDELFVKRGIQRGGTRIQENYCSNMDRQTQFDTKSTDTEKTAEPSDLDVVVLNTAVDNGALTTDQIETVQFELSTLLLD